MPLSVYLLLQLFLFRLLNTSSFKDEFLIYKREASIFFNYPATEEMIISYTKEEEH